MPEYPQKVGWRGAVGARERGRVMTRPRTQVFWASVAVGVMFAGGIGIASASIPDSRGVITACIKGQGEYFVDTERGQRCGKGRTTVRWNTTGPRGPQGRQGAKGAKGDTGPAGAAGAPGVAADFDAIQVVKNTEQVPSGVNSWSVSATCPAGTRVIAGGGDSLTSDALMTGSAPLNAPVGSSDSGWTTSWETDNSTPTGSPFAATAWATCVPD